MFNIIMSWVWAFTVLIGVTYLVFWKDQSGWWYLLAIILMGAGFNGFENNIISIN